MAGWSKVEQATKVLSLLPEGAVVNLGVGLPVVVADVVGDDTNIVFHCENGLVGYRAAPPGTVTDKSLVNASQDPVRLVTGASVVAHDVSFALARGGRLDATILGAHQVSQNGDLANWSKGKLIAGVGGAMDLAVGAKVVIVMMRHTEKDGRAKIVVECDLPLTAPRCVKHIVTDLAHIAVTPQGLVVRAMASGVTPEDLIERTAAPLTFALGLDSPGMPCHPIPLVPLATRATGEPGPRGCADRSFGGVCPGGAVDSVVVGQRATSPPPSSALPHRRGLRGEHSQECFPETKDGVDERQRGAPHHLNPHPDPQHPSAQPLGDCAEVNSARAQENDR